MILAFFFAAIGLSLCAITINLRRQPVPPEQLEPNLLMTKHPIEFWTGPRTIFHFQAYWHDWPVNLAAHGYEVLFVELPWNNHRSRLRQAKMRLESSRRHLVMDECTAREMADLLRAYPPASVTVMTAPVPRGTLDHFCFLAHGWSLRLRGLRPAAKTPVQSAEMLRQRMRALAEDDWTAGFGLSS